MCVTHECACLCHRHVRGREWTSGQRHRLVCLERRFESSYRRKRTTTPYNSTRGQRVHGHRQRAVRLAFSGNPPKPPAPYTRRKKRTTAPSGSARRLRVLKPGSVARGAHSLQPGTCSESSLRQCSHAHSGNRTGAFTARARRFNRWSSTHHSHEKHHARIPTQRHPTMCAKKRQRNASDSLTMTGPLESVCV